MLGDINRTINTVEVKLNGKTIGIYVDVNSTNDSLRKKQIDYNKVSYHYGTLTEKQNNELFWKLIRERKFEKVKQEAWHNGTAVDY